MLHAFQAREAVVVLPLIIEAQVEHVSFDSKESDQTDATYHEHSMREVDPRRLPPSTRPGPGLPELTSSCMPIVKRHGLLYRGYSHASATPRASALGNSTHH